MSGTILTGCPCTVDVQMKPAEAEPAAEGGATPNGNVTDTAAAAAGAKPRHDSLGVTDEESGEVT